MPILIKIVFFDPFQIAFLEDHSTETDLLSITDIICSTLNRKDYSKLILIDLPFYVDTLDHTILFRGLL